MTPKNKIFILLFFFSGLGLITSCNYRQEETCLIPLATIPSIVRQIIPVDNGLYVLPFGSPGKETLLFVTKEGAVQPLNLRESLADFDFVGMFAVLNQQRFIFLCPESNRVECRDYFGKLVWHYKSRYTAWRVGNLRRGKAFIIAGDGVAVLYTRVGQLIRLIWLHGADGRVLKMLSPLDFKGVKNIVDFGLGECKGMQLDDDGTLMIAFNNTIFRIDPTARVKARKFPHPIIGLYRDGRNILVAIMTKNGVLDLLALQKDMRLRRVSKIIFKKNKLTFIGIDKNNFYFTNDLGLIWRTERKRILYISSN